MFGSFGGKLRVLTSGVTGPVEALNGDGSVFSTLSPACPGADCAALAPYRPSDSLTVTLTGQGGLGDLRGTGTPQFLQSSTGASSITAALGEAGQAALPQVYAKAWNVADGSVVGGFPRRQDGFPFYTAPLAADLAADGTRQVIESNDSYWVHAFSVNGGEAPGFPKYTGQWPSFSGVVGDPQLNGRQRLFYGTREGSVFVWNVRGDTTHNDSWWHYRHDERNTGLYGLDTRRPAAIDDLRRGPGPGVTLTWTAPGSDYQVGKAARYDIRVSSSPISESGFWQAHEVAGAPTPGPAGTRESLALTPPRPGRLFVAVRTLDAAGNASALSKVVRIAGPP